jgi:hypothetical protein
VLLRLLHQLDQPRVGRIGQDGDAEGKSHWKVSIRGETTNFSLRSGRLAG